MEKNALEKQGATMRSKRKLKEALITNNDRIVINAVIVDIKKHRSV